jgi:hypothetical protein
VGAGQGHRVLVAVRLPRRDETSRPRAPRGAVPRVRVLVDLVQAPARAVNAKAARAGFGHHCCVADDDDEAPAIERLFSDMMLAPFAEVIRANNRLMFSNVLADSYAPIQSALAQISAAQTQRLIGLIPQTNVFQGLLAQLMPALERFGSLLESCMPTNWPSSPGVYLGDAVGIVNSGIPLAWVPGPEMVTALTSAPDLAARHAILADHAAEIAGDCSAVLTEVVNPELKALAVLASEAAGALSSFPAAAQALATNVFDTLLRDICRRGVILQPVPNRGWYGRVRSQLEPIGDKTLLVELRQACVIAPAGPALQNYTPGDPPPEAFTRHATAHGAGPEQYSKVNAVISVMLAASMLREAQESGW